MDWESEEVRFLTKHLEFYRALGDSMAHFSCYHIRLGHDVILHCDPTRECAVIRCVTCESESNSLDSLLDHIRDGCRGSVICKCGEPYLLYPCDTCQSEFNDPDDFVDHVRAGCGSGIGKCGDVGSNSRGERKK